MRIEIIVVDNNSSDETVECVRSMFPQVIIICNSLNRGFAEATNQGLRVSHGHYILLLNPDTVIKDGALNKMIIFAKSHPEVGLIGPMLQGHNGEVQKYCARSFPRPLDWFWHSLFIGIIFPKSRVFGRLFLSYWDHLDSRRVDAIAGAAMLFSRKTLDEVGLLDESLPMYFEDLDYCYRISKTGKLVYYLADATIIHYGGQSSIQVANETRILILEAYRLFFLRYRHSTDANLYRLLAIIASFTRFYVFALINCFTIIFGKKASYIRNYSLQGECVTFLWGLKLIKKSSID
jgi:GT2 family glycosyltransferase